MNRSAIGCSYLQNTKNNAVNTIVKPKLKIMKNLIIIPFLLITILINGQKFDFSTKTVSGDTVRKQSGVISNKNFTFSVKNINTLKYDVLINNLTVNYNKEVPALLSQFKKEDDGLTKGVTPKDGKSVGLVDSSGTSFEEDVITLEHINNIYIELSKCSQFYSLLVEITESDMAPEKMIDYKKACYQRYLDVKSINDNNDAVNIYSHYRSKIREFNYKWKQMTQIAATDKVIVDSLVKETRKIDALDIPAKLATLYYQINKETFTVNTFIPKPNSDDLIINLTLKPYSKSSNSEIKMEIPFQVQGGVKIDFSTGIFFSNITNKQYINKPNYVNDTINGYYLVKSDDNPLSYGLAGYMHVYCRRACDFNMAFTLGVGVDQDMQTKFMPGFSLLLGRNERFIINGGMAIGLADDLSKVQDPNRLYPKQVDPVYTKSYEIGYFFGISYNLSK